MRLIGDIGGTKATWIWKNNQGQIRRINTLGYHPLHSGHELFDILENTELTRLARQWNQLCYYGTACESVQMADTVKKQLKKIFPYSDIKVYSDLLGATRAACGHKPGVSCILGTGSSSCLYDGKNIRRQVPSLGYILADEAGGADLGKRLLTAYFYGRLEKNTVAQLKDSYQISKDQVLSRLYKKSAANRYLASFAPFVLKHQKDQAIRRLTRDSIDSFIRNHILGYPESGSLPIYFSGSIAWYFSALIAERLSEHGLKPAGFFQSPIDRLLAYHETKT